LSGWLCHSSKLTIVGADLKEEVEEMSGYEDRNWELLKKQLLNRFGSSLALVKYTREDLKNLIKTYTDKGGINTLEDFKMFRSKFENITHYLGRMGYVTNLEDFRENILEVLSSDLEITVTRELIRDNKMLVSKDGGDILPDTATLFTYIHREVQTASVMERRNKIKRGEVKYVNPTQPTKPTPIPEKDIEELTKTLASWNVQKKPTTFFQSSHVPYAPAQFNRPPEYFTCQYCHMQGHATGRCNLANFDEIKGRVKKEGREFKLPDGSVIPFDRSRSFKTAVDQYHSKSSQPGVIKLPQDIQPPKKEEKVPEAQTSFGKLEEIEFEDSTYYESDAAKRARRGEDKEEPEKS
jgi:hypothetical protein